MVVENPFPGDRRVWNETTALAAAGHRLAVIALRANGDKAYENIRGIDVYRLRRITVFKKVLKGNSSFLRRVAVGVQAVVGYAFEYGYFTLGSFLISLYVCTRTRIDVIHLHNPPDTLCVLAAFYKCVGKKIVFDHHDLSPELYLSRYNKAEAAKPLVYRVLRVLERFSLRLADVVLATNESYREIDIRRGRIDPRKVFVVRNGPDLKVMKETAPDDGLRSMGKTILVYIGVMSPQDGVDYLLRALHHLVYALGRRSVYCLIVGSGDSLEDLKTLARELKIDEYVSFTGFVTDNEVVRYLSTADICVAPDPSSPLNDVSTWIKVMEYMALAKPIVAFDLKETRYSAQGAAVYVRPNDEREFARAIETLMYNASLREEMGMVGRMRVERELSWDVVKNNLLTAYRSLTRREAIG